MLREEDIAIELKCQGYECKTYMRNVEGTASVLIFESKRKTEEERCPYCGGKVNICELTSKTLRDVPIWTGITQELCFHCHRYRCIACALANGETVVTGRYVPTRLLAQADYVSRIVPDKHPYQTEGLKARKGVEW